MDYLREIPETDSGIKTEEDREAAFRDYLKEAACQWVHTILKAAPQTKETALDPQRPLHLSANLVLSALETYARPLRGGPGKPWRWALVDYVYSGEMLARSEAVTND